MSDIVFIGAVGRSGTTLLERSIATSPSFVCLGEMVHLWERGLRLDEPCGCGRPFTQCPFWTAVAQRAFGGWQELDLDQVRQWKNTADRNRYIPLLIVPRLGGSGFRAALSGLIGVLDALYTAIGEQAASDAGAPVVLIDSSKHPSYLFVLRHLTSHRVRLLHVVRDPRGVAHSWSKSVERPEGGDEMEQLGPWRASARWTSHNLLFQLAARLGVRRRRLTYERFTENPAELGLVLEMLCGDDPAVDRPLTMPRFVDRSLDLGCDHTVSGNPLRFKSGTLTIRSDDVWQQSMPRGHRRIVAILTMPLRFGPLRFGHPR